jgi:alginate O-acetyltransferase complex protein AlgI
VLFNSIEFLLFFPVVVAIYFATPQRYRWALLLAASYYFYASWKPEYLLLIIASTLVDYGCGLRMGSIAGKARRKKWLLVSLTSNLGLLFAFKYFNFFNESARAVFDRFNIFYDVPAFDLLLPVGISFYTFQTLSYSIDVYRGRQRPERHLGIFALYVSFFPQLVAGPIERSTHLLPQFFQPHRFEYDRVTSGLRLVLWGFFKKVVVADRLALYVNAVYNDPSAHTGPTILLATYFFAFQIYCDFSGYSDIAIGTARVMGYDLMQNFRRPYFARSISEFWSRWHISLSTWFRDYLYIPLGGNRVPRWRWYVNLFAVFLISGLWHGANWTFVVWGALHGTYLIVGLVTSDARERFWQRLEELAARLPALTVPAPVRGAFAVAGAALPGGGGAGGTLALSAALPATRRDSSAAGRQGGARDRGETGRRAAVARLRSGLAVATTFHLVLFAWIFFRANSIGDVAVLFGALLDWDAPLADLLEPVGLIRVTLSVLGVVALLAVHAVQHRWEGRRGIGSLPTPLRWACYYALLLAILVLGEFGATQFIYFQF